MARWMIDSVPGFTGRCSQTERNGSRALIRRLIERERGGEQKAVGRFARRASCDGTGRTLRSGRFKRPEGEWRSAKIARVPGAGPDNGSRALISPCAGFETGAERMSPRSNGLGNVSGVDSKRQVGSVDLAMVAKASLRASERPFRVSGSGKMFYPSRVRWSHRPGAR
jgi:hypothetical protein